MSRLFHVPYRERAMPSAVEVNDLVQRWWPLAGGLARKYGDRFPWLAHCFESAAGEALWKLATSHGHLEPAAFSGYVRKAVRWAVLRRLEVERVRNRAAFLRERPDDDQGADELLDLLADDAPDVGHDLEHGELVAVLLDRADLTALQREAIERHFLRGEMQIEIAAAESVSHKAVGQRISVAIEKVRAAAG